MKSSILVLFIACFMAMQLNAQIEYKNEFKAGYGLGSGTEIAVGIGSAIGTAIGASLGLAIGDVVSVLVNGTPTNVTITAIESDSRLLGTFQLGYNRYLSKRFSVGLQGNYNPFSLGYVIKYSNGTQSTTETKYAFTSLLGRLDYNYIAKPKFQLYSGLMGGGMVDLKHTDEGVIPFGHLVVLGLRFGNQNALNLEGGIGLGPLISAGYSRKF